MSNDTPDEPFFSRWSRQKRAGQPQKPAAAVPPVEAAEAEPEVDLATLPKIEDLTAESDISVFLRKGVPEALQKLALRRMWSLDPEISNFVEVAENQFDFHAAGGVYGLFQELPAEADMSVWLAQATQSVVRKDKTEQAEAAAAGAPAKKFPDDSAVQHEAPASQSREQASDRSRVTHSANGNQSARQDQGIELEQVSGVPASRQEPAERPSRRRRHGGALPA